MTPTVERLRQEATRLSYDEKEALVRALELDLDAFMSASEDPEETEAAWNKSIAERLRALEAGHAAPITSRESEERIDDIFASHRTRRTL